MGVKREILVLGGEHGEELPGIELVRSLQSDRIDGIFAKYANWPAVEAGVRYIDENQAQVHPGHPNAISNERYQANQNIQSCFSFDLVVNVHSYEGAGDAYAFVGERMSLDVFKAVALMGIRRIVVNRASTHQLLCCYMPNCFGIELPKGSRLRDIPHMRSMLGKLATCNFPDELPDFEVFADIENGAVTEARARELDLPKSLPPFTRLEPKYVKRLGFDRRRKLYAQDWHADSGEYRGALATDYNFSRLLRKLRTVNECWDEDLIDESVPYRLYDLDAGARL
jgi:hypothetical protein